MLSTYSSLILNEKTKKSKLVNMIINYYTFKLIHVVHFFIINEYSNQFTYISINLIKLSKIIDGLWS